MTRHLPGPKQSVTGGFPIDFSLLRSSSGMAGHVLREAKHARDVGTLAHAIGCQRKCTVIATRGGGAFQVRRASLWGRARFAAHRALGRSNG